MTDLVEFLRARLDEDAKVAEGWPTDELPLSRGDEYGTILISADRVLAEVEAKRRIIDWAVDYMEGDHAPWNVTCLELLALPYADHPDYNPEWKP